MMCASPYTFTEIKSLHNAYVTDIIERTEDDCFAACFENERCIALQYLKNTVCWLYVVGPHSFGPIQGVKNFYRLNRDPIYLPRSVAIPML